MNQKVLQNVWLRICMIVAVVTTAFAGTAWAEDNNTPTPITVSLRDIVEPNGQIDGNISFETTAGICSDGVLTANKITLKASNKAKINSVTFHYVGPYASILWNSYNNDIYDDSNSEIDNVIGNINEQDKQYPTVSEIDCDKIVFSNRNNPSGNLVINKISVTYTPADADYKITYLSSDESKGTVELNGNVIIAKPKPGYGVADDADNVVNSYTTDGNANVVRTGNNFVVKPSAACSVTINFVAHVGGFSLDFEEEENLNNYTDWAFSNSTVRSVWGDREKAHNSPGYYVMPNSTTAWIRTANTVDYPGTFTCYVRRMSWQESLTWKIQVSPNGSNWTDVKTYTPDGTTATEWEEFSADLSRHTDVYVRLYYTGSGTNGAIDDIVLTTATATVPVSVADYGYSTFCCHRALDFTNSSITAYYVTTNGNKLTYNQITKVPADTGVLLHKAGGVTDEEVPALIGNPDGVPGNVLVPGSDETVITWTADDKKYILYNHPTKGVGFFGANNSPVPSNRAYLQLSGDYVKSYIIDLEDDATSIEKTLSDSPLKSENIYNLAGQRMSKMQKGINIVNGKKVLF